MSDDRVFMHDVFYQGVIRRYHERLQRNYSDQLASSVQNVAGVDRLRIESYFLDVFERLLYRIRLLQIDIFRRHQRAGSIILVLEEGIYELAFVFRRLLEYLVYDIRRKFFKHIDHVVEVEFVEYVFDFRICDDVYDVDLIIYAELGKNIHADIFRKRSEKDDHPLQVEFAPDVHQQFGYLDFIMFKEFISGLEVSLGLEKLDYPDEGLIICLIHVRNHIYILHRSVLLSVPSSQFPLIIATASSSVMMATPSSRAVLFLDEPESGSFVMR